MLPKQPFGGRGGLHTLFSHRKFTVKFPSLVTYPPSHKTVHKRNELSLHVTSPLLIMGNTLDAQISSVKSRTM